MTPEQSLVVLEMACYDDQFIDGNFHYSNHTDVEKIGLVLIANKTRYHLASQGILIDINFTLSKVRSQEGRLPVFER